MTELAFRATEGAGAPVQGGQCPARQGRRPGASRRLGGVQEGRSSLLGWARILNLGCLGRVGGTPSPPTCSGERRGPGRAGRVASQGRAGRGLAVNEQRRGLRSVCPSLPVLQKRFLSVYFSFSPHSEKAVAPHSSALAWKLPWTEEPGGLQSMGSLGVEHDWATLLSCIGEGNGNPLQCSCLENPRDGGAWWAAVCGVAQSRTRLKWLSSSSSSALLLRVRWPRHQVCSWLARVSSPQRCFCITI